jgi:hypothetical protein
MSKPAIYWRNWENLEKELQVVINELGHFPTSGKLREIGRSDLDSAIYRYHGGINKIRKKLNLNLERKPPNYWKSWNNLENELKIEINRIGYFPTQDDLRKISRDDIVNAIHRHHGGMNVVKEKMGYELPRKPMGYYKSWENTKKELQQLIVKLGHFPTHLELVELKCSSLSSAIAYHGGYYEVRGKMGYEPIQKPLNYWKDWKNLQGELHLICDELGEFPTQDDIRKMGRDDIVNAIHRYHGGMNVVIEKMGYDIRRQSWKKHVIIERILELNEQGEDLNHRYVSLKHTALCKAAYRYFDTWENAIEAAGLDYNFIRKDTDFENWSKQKIIDRILELYELKEDLSYRSMQISHPALQASACRYFGRWKNAIEASSLDYEKIRKDVRKEIYRGILFEKYVRRIFNIMEIKVLKKSFKFEEETVKPDFVVINTGLWIDAKLGSWTGGIENTARKYLKYVDKLVIIYLIGKPRKWHNDKVVFKSVKEYYPQLKSIGREDIIYDLSLLERGIIPNKQQKVLDDYF